MIYLLDTNVCIALINDNDRRVRDRFRRASVFPGTIAVPTVVAFELWYGVANRGRPAANADQLAASFRGPIDLLPFDGDDARVAGLIRAALRSVGEPIGAYDTADRRPGAPARPDPRHGQRDGVLAGRRPGVGGLGGAGA